jgi:hypothetical protein
VQVSQARRQLGDAPSSSKGATSGALSLPKPDFASSAYVRNDAVVRKRSTVSKAAPMMRKTLQMLKRRK